ncbi:MAG TPA: aspartate aminotransferase family protein [Candidatus Margulisiibacteriota bacterium]|nr:aspartate aminotransferase family protein [Candidatus Margulisiibacteriota bacterium]
MPNLIPDLDDILRLDRAHVIHPITEFRKQEQHGSKIFVGGRGIELQLADGRTVIDGFSGLFNISVGHGRREIADAVATQLHKLAYYPSFWDFGNEPATRLAERLVGLLPADRHLNHVLFHSGGSEANEANFKFARLYHALRGKQSKVKILSRRWAFHGATRGAGTATGILAYHAFIEQDASHAYFAPPYCYRCEFGKIYPDCGLACAHDLEAQIEREGADTVAAVILEPVMGTGGMLVPPPDYFGPIQEICQRHDVLLILDEVVTGFGRTGKWFGMQHWNIEPDLVSFAKGISSGYLPLSASVVSDRIYDTIRDEMPDGIPLMFGLTYNNHPTCCAAGLANIDIIEREGLVDNARRVGTYLLERLREALGRSPIVGEIRGLGMLAAIEIVRDQAAKEPFPNIEDPHRIVAAAFERGLIARALFQCVALAPPLISTTADIDRILGILQAVWPQAERDILQDAG